MSTVPTLATALVAVTLVSAGCIRSGADISLRVEGSGRVVSEPSSLDCTSRAGASNEGSCYLYTGETLTMFLRAEPAPGASFAGWTYEVGRDCNGSKCQEGAPADTFSATSKTAIVVLDAYPNHQHVKVVARFDGP